MKRAPEIERDSLFAECWKAAEAIIKDRFYPGTGYSPSDVLSLAYSIHSEAAGMSGMATPAPGEEGPE